METFSSHETEIHCKNSEAKDVQLATGLTEHQGTRPAMPIVGDTTERKGPQDALRESEARFRSVFRDSPIAIEIYNSDGQPISVNRAWQDMFGLPEAAQPAWPRLFDDPYLPRQSKDALRKGEVVRYEVRFDFDDVKRLGLYKGNRSGIAHLDVLISPFGSSEGKVPTGYMVQIQETTARKMAEEASHRSEDRFRSVYVESPIAIIICDSHGQLVDANRACLNMWGLSDVSQFKWPGIFRDRYIPDEARDKVRDGKVTRYEVPYDFEEANTSGVYGGRRSGTAHLDVLISPFGSDKTASDGYLMQIQEITERKRAEKELRELSSKLVEVQEKERRHMAHELHDQVGQSLTGLRLLLEMAIRRPGGDVSSTLTEARNLTNGLLTLVNNLSLDLRPSMLDDFGVLPALLWLFERYATQTGVLVKVEHRGLQRRFAPQLETAVYRIVQEALTNVACHAGVNEVFIRLLAHADRLTIQVEDKGIGFDPDLAFATRDCIGLIGMRERAISHGGQLIVKSWRGRGTEVMAELPLHYKTDGK